MNDDFELIRGSGNVFRDFGRTSPDLKQTRAIIAAEIIRTLDERGLSTREAEKLIEATRGSPEELRVIKTWRAIRAKTGRL